MDFRRYVWGWETLISRYRVCSELAGSQSERVLTLAAHSVHPRLSLSRALPPSPSFHRSRGPPFSSLRALRLPRVPPLPAAQTTLALSLPPPASLALPPPTTSAPGESSDGAFSPPSSPPPSLDLPIFFPPFFSSLFSVSFPLPLVPRPPLPGESVRHGPWLVAGNIGGRA